MTNLLKQLRILDTDGTLSLTSIVLMVAVVKFALASPMDVATLTALLGALAAYQGKKVIGKMGSSSETSESLADLDTKVQALNNKLMIVEARTAPKR